MNRIESRGLSEKGGDRNIEQYCAAMAAQQTIHARLAQLQEERHEVEKSPRE